MSDTKGPLDARDPVFYPLERGFVKHASVEAIEVHLASARAERRAAKRRENALISLLTERKRQIEVGEWPAR